MKRSISKLALPFLVVLSAACASASGGGSEDSPVGNTDIITREEINRTGSAQNAYQLIQTLRPQWLITRGITNLRQAAGEEDIVIYMDNARLGYRDQLRRVPLGGVRYLEFFDAPHATQRWGGGHIHGAILISTRDR